MLETWGKKQTPLEIYPVTHHFVLSGTIWYYLALSGTIWGYLVLSDAIWGYLGISDSNELLCGLFRIYRPLVLFPREGFAPIIQYHTLSFRHVLL